jgi:hypothetical protein
MSGSHQEGASTADAPDLTFRATLDLHADCEQQAAQPVKQRTLVGCVRRLWADHETLLVRFLLVAFVLLIITAVQLLFPSKAESIIGLLCAALNNNGTRRAGRLDTWCDS